MKYSAYTAFRLYHAHKRGRMKSYAKDLTAEQIQEAIRLWRVWGYDTRDLEKIYDDSPGEADQKQND